MSGDTEGSAGMLGSVAGKPVAWAALRDDGDIAWIGYTPEGAADGAGGRRVVPLYREPTLTDAEREDVACAASRLDSDPNGPRDRQVAATLRRLLERTSG